MARAYVVHLVDPDADACSQWARILADSGFEVRSFASAAAFLSRGLAARPDCVVAEAMLGKRGGLELQARVRELDPGVPVVFASGGADIRTIVHAMRAGAVDFLQKPVAHAALLDAVERAVERSAAFRKAEEQRVTSRERLGRLTPRERVIFAQVLQGRLNKQIAAALECQEATVKVHRSRLMRKLGVRSVVRLVQFAQELGLDQPVME